MLLHPLYDLMQCVQAEDFRALLQLDCLGNARYLPRLRHMRVGMALARPESSVAYLASCTALERLDLDLRVPDDAQVKHWYA